MRELREVAEDKSGVGDVVLWEVVEGRSSGL